MDQNLLKIPVHQICISFTANSWGQMSRSVDLPICKASMAKAMTNCLQQKTSPLQRQLLRQWSGPTAQSLNKWQLQEQDPPAELEAAQGQESLALEKERTCIVYIFIGSAQNRGRTCREWVLCSSSLFSRAFD